MGGGLVLVSASTPFSLRVEEQLEKRRHPPSSQRLICVHVLSSLHFCWHSSIDMSFGPWKLFKPSPLQAPPAFSITKYFPSLEMSKTMSPPWLLGSRSPSPRHVMTSQSGLAS